MTTEAAETPVQPALTAKQGGQNPRSAATEAANVTAVRDNAHEEPMDVMSAVLAQPNMQRAYARVLRNKGAPGVDGIKVDDLKDYLKAHWPTHKQELLDGTYKPKPVRKVEIPKAGGGKRQLGIPTVLDRLIQQALHQVLSPVFEPGFSEFSYGFRPGRNAGQAVQQARGYVEAGHRWVVDIDLEAFFDRVNHDMLMARVARQVKDKRKILWLQWKRTFTRAKNLRPSRAHCKPGQRTFTRAKNLMRLGLDEKRAWDSAQNGRGSWWNSGASHLNQALPKVLFDRLGLISLMDYHQLKRLT